MKITFDQFKKIVGKIKDVDEWYSAIVSQSEKYEINTQYRWAGFLAQVMHESGKFKYTVENLNYSAAALDRVFPKYFKRAGRKASQYARKPEQIANIVYANRMGNGDIKSGDGWKHRGRGIIQLTGKYNYTNFAKSIGMSVDEAIDWLGTKDGSVAAAMWYWKVNDLNSYCDKKDIKGLSIRINGGTNGLSDRISLWNKILGILPATTEKVEPIKDVEEVSVQTIEGVIGIGDRGENVKSLQKALGGLVADGIFGPNTKRAVKNFQRNAGLIPDGVVGPRLFKTIVGN